VGGGGRGRGEGDQAHLETNRRTRDSLPTRVAQLEGEAPFLIGNVREQIEKVDAGEGKVGQDCLDLELGEVGLDLGTGGASQHQRKGSVTRNRTSFLPFEGVVWCP